MNYLQYPVTNHRYWQRLFGISAMTILVISLLIMAIGPSNLATNVFAETTGNTYYVATNGSDTNPGTISQPLASIQKAIKKAKAGDTVQVRGGTYHEALRIADSGTAAQPITIMAYPGEQPILDGRYTLPEGSIARCNNEVSPPVCFTFNALVRIIGSHIRFQGFELKQSYGRGMTIGNTAAKPTTDVIIRDCNIHDVRNNQIQARFAEDILVENCIAYHGSDYATHSRGTAELNWPSMLVALDADRVTFRGNTVHNNWGGGIQAGAGASAVTIEGNVIYDNLGLQSYTHRARNVIIRDNLMYHTNDPDFLRGDNPSGCVGLNNEKDFAAAPHIKGVEIYNNIFVGCQKNVALWSSDGTDTLIEDVSIHHNTLVNATANSTLSAVNLSIACDANVKGIVIEKNIIYQRALVKTSNPCLGNQSTTITNNAAANNDGATNAPQSAAANALEQFIGQAPNSNQIRYVSNLWWPAVPNGMESGNDLVVDPQLVNPDVTLVPGGVTREPYLPRASSPAVAGGQGARGNGTVIATPVPGAPTATPMPTATPTAPRPTPVACQSKAGNPISNAGFETGKLPWQFRTNGRGSYQVNGPGFECSQAAQIQIQRQGRNVLFLQKRIALESNTRYRLSFYAYSTSGNDMKVYLEKNGGKRGNYGVRAMRADLTTTWRQYTTEFTATGFSGTATDARLRFWLAPFDAAGDDYWIDQVVLEKLNSGRSGDPTVPGVEVVELIEDPDDAVTGGTVSGYIKITKDDGSQAPVEEVEVILADEESAGYDFEATVETDETGYYYVEGVPVGDHTLTVIPPSGYIAAAADTIHMVAEEAIEQTYTLEKAVGVIYLPLISND